MTLLTKSLGVVLFFSLVVILFALLPSTSEYPLPSEFSSSLIVIFSYYFAWSSVFTALNTLLTCTLLVLGFELGIFIWKIVTWVIGFVSRIVA